MYWPELISIDYPAHGKEFHDKNGKTGFRLPAQWL
jgi:hypothetical protein